MMGMGEVLLVVSVVVLIFGAKRIPQIGSSLGSSIKNFKKGLGSGDDDDNPSRDVSEYKGPGGPEGPKS